MNNYVHDGKNWGTSDAPKINASGAGTLLGAVNVIGSYQSAPIYYVGVVYYSELSKVPPSVLWDEVKRLRAENLSLAGRVANGVYCHGDPKDKARIADLERELAAEKRSHENTWKMRCEGNVSLSKTRDALQKIAHEATSALKTATQKL